MMLLAVACGIAALATATDAAAAAKWQCKETGDLLGASPGHGRLTFTATAKLKQTAQQDALGACLQHRFVGRPIDARTCKPDGCQQVGR